MRFELRSGCRYTFETDRLFGNVSNGDIGFRRLFSKYRVGYEINVWPRIYWGSLSLNFGDSTNSCSIYCSSIFRMLGINPSWSESSLYIELIIQLKFYYILLVE